MRLFLPFAIAFTIAACEQVVPRSPLTAKLYTVTEYDVRPTATTLGGVALDLSGQPATPDYMAKVDRVTGEAFACLGLPRRPLVLKVPGDWFLNCDGTQQVLPGYAGECDPRKAGDCQKVCAGGAHWRAFLQRDASLVSAPSLYLLKDPLVRLLTGVQEIWGDPRLSACANPSSTGPLDGF